MTVPAPRRRLGFYSVCRLKEGECWYWSDHRPRPFRVEVGQVILTAPGLLHSYGHQDHACREDYVSFVGPVADRLNTLGMFNPRRPIVRIPDPVRIERIAEIIGGESASVEDHLRAGMILQDIIFDANYRAAGANAPDHSPIDRLLVRLDESPQEHLSNEDMASICGMSESHFRRRFREKVGMPPNAYGERVRMDHARNMLESTTQKVSAVAESLGYSDPLYFSKRFAAVVGMSPRAYRKYVRGQTRE